MKTTLTFHSCGLNRKHNLLESPLGMRSNGEAISIVNTNGDVCGFIYSALKESEYNCCAIFALETDDTMIYGRKFSNEITLYVYDGPNVKGAISSFQKKYRFQRYGLL